MQSVQKRNFSRPLLIIGAAVILVVAALVFVIPRFFSNRNDQPLPKYYAPDAMINDLREAEKRWATRPFSSYRIKIEGLACSQDVEVHNDRIFVVYSIECSRSGLTVSDLFRNIEDDMATPHWLNGIGCDLKVVHPVFEPKWGYPEKVEYKQEWGSDSNLNKQYFDKYMAPKDEPCTLMGFVFYGYSVKALTPISSETF